MFERCPLLFGASGTAGSNSLNQGAFFWCMWISWCSRLFLQGSKLCFLATFHRIPCTSAQSRSPVVQGASSQGRTISFRAALAAFDPVARRVPDARNVACCSKPSSSPSSGPDGSYSLFFEGFLFFGTAYNKLLIKLPLPDLLYL